MQFQPRSVLWPGQLPTNSNGTPRPKLAPRRPTMTIHYTGSTANYGDPGDSPTEIRTIQAWAQSQRKPWEYNYVVDTEGVVWEYAGEYRAAHSAGNNETAVGVLLLLGVTNPPSDPLIEATRWWRQELITKGLLAARCATVKHKDMGTTPTACPGKLVEARWADFLVPWQQAPAPTPPTQPGVMPPPAAMEEEDNMALLTRYVDNSIWVVAENFSWKFRISEATHDSIKSTGRYTVAAIQPADLEQIPGKQ